MHDLLLARAACADSPVILRLRMLPYSIGHELMLTRLGNPLLGASRQGDWENGGTGASRAALTQAVLVCSRPWSERQKKEKWGRLWSFFNRRCDFFVEAERFRAYRAQAFTDLPTVQMPRTKDAVYHYYGAPLTARLLLFAGGIFKNLGYTTPYDFPIALALVLSSTVMEEEGKIWVKNWKDFEDEQRLKLFEEQNKETFSAGHEAVRAAAEKWNAEHPESKVPDWILTLGTEKQAPPG